MNDAATSAEQSPRHDLAIDPATLVRRAILASARELDAALATVAASDRAGRRRSTAGSAASPPRSATTTS